MIQHFVMPPLGSLGKMSEKQKIFVEINSILNITNQILVVLLIC